MTYIKSRPFHSKHAAWRNHGGRWQDRWMGWASCRTYAGVTDFETTKRTFFKFHALCLARKLEREMIVNYGDLIGR